MKLLFVSNLFPDTREPYRGLDNATLLHELRKQFEIRVLAVRPALPFRKMEKRKCREIDSVFQPVFTNTSYVPKVGSAFNHHLFAAAIRQPILALQKEFPFDVILVSWTFPDTAAIAKLQPQINVPFVGIVQGSDAHAYLKMPTRRNIIVRALNQSSSTITRSAKLAQMLGDAGVNRAKLHPVYNGVDLEMFRPTSDKTAARRALNLPPDQPLLLFVGNFLPVKNPHLLVQAHADACKRQTGNCPTLVMIGGGPLESSVRQLADELGFGKHVILAGRKLAPEVARYMQAADLLCLSSENEGVPNVILEAFASGIPVMSTNVGGISEVVSEKFLGRLVDRGDLSAMANAIKGLLSTPPQTERIREHALNFSWEKAAAAYAALLKQAVSS